MPTAGQEARAVDRDILVKLRPEIATQVEQAFRKSHQSRPDRARTEELRELLWREAPQLAGQLRLVSAARVARPARPEGEGLARIYRLVVDHSPAEVDLLVQRLDQSPLVEYAEVNQPRSLSGWSRRGLTEGFTADTFDPDDPRLPDQWFHAAIDSPDVWQSITTGDPRIVIAVIDTGIELSHEDLADNIYINQGEYGDDGSGGERQSNGIDDDGNGYVDDWRGWNFFDDDNDPSDFNGHGTHVAGISAALGNNGVGGLGVAPGCTLLALGIGSIPTVAEIAEALTYAADNGATVVNMSFGGSLDSQVEQEAIVYAAAQGVVPIASAGNSSSNIDIGQVFPASYTEVIAVAATDSQGEMAMFTSWGSTVDVAAPGVNVVSTYLDNDYRRMDGTSMAAPVVSGVAALIQSVALVDNQQLLDPVQVRNILREQVTEPVTAPLYIGTGIINARLAIEGIANSSPSVRAKIVSPLRSAQISGREVAVEGITEGAAHELTLGRGHYPEQRQLITSGSGAIDGLITSIDTWRHGDGVVNLRLKSIDAIGTCFDDSLLEINNNYFLEDPYYWDLAARHVMGDTYVFRELAGAFSFADGIKLHLVVADSDSQLREILYQNPNGSWISDHTSVQWQDANTAVVSVSSSARFTEGHQTVRVVSENSLGTLSEENAAIYLGPFKSGWPQKIRADEPGGSVGLLAPVVSDLDGDGDQEIVVLADSDDVSSSLVVLAADGTSTRLDIAGDCYEHQVPSVADIDRDGNKEILLYCREASYPLIFAISPEGVIERKVGLSEATYNTPNVTAVAVNLDDDESLELVTAYQDGEDGKVIAHNIDGTLVPGFPALLGQGRNPSNPAAGDLDGDGWPELVLTNETFAYYQPDDERPSSVVVIDRFGEQVWSREVELLSSSAPAIGDLDRDGSAEIVVTSYLGAHILSADGELVAEYTWSENRRTSAAALGDVDGDGDLEIAFVWAPWLYCIHHDGSLAFGKSTSSSAYPPVIADVSSDMLPDVIATDYSGTIYAYDHSGQLLDPFPLKQAEHSSFFASPVVADLERNGEIDIVAVSNIDYGIISVWELEDARYRSQHTPWPMYMQNERRTGEYLGPDLEPSETRRPSGRRGSPGIPSPPATAPELSAVTVSAREIALSWSHVQTAKGYRLYRGSTLVYDGYLRSHDHGGLAPGHQYCYQVLAYNAAGDGPASPEQCTWTEGEWQSTGLTGTAIWALAVDPGDSSIVYAGSYGHGIFKSSDGGDHWQQADTGTNVPYLQDLAIDPSAPETIWAASWFHEAGSPWLGEVVRSDDGGASWSLSRDGVWSRTLVVDASDPSTIYVGTQGQGVLKTEDGGATWLAHNSGLPSVYVKGIAIDPRDSMRLYAATEGGVAVSTDAGVSWVERNQGLTRGFCESVAVDPFDSANVLVGTDAQLFKSNDSGLTWSLQMESPYRVESIVFHPRVRDLVLAGSYGYGVYISSDGGTTWTELNLGLTNIRIKALCVTNDNPTVLYAGAAGGYTDTDMGDVFRMVLPD
jgi:photosystem II stability/assembly factor-like uncharacterized protein